MKHLEKQIKSIDLELSRLPSNHISCEKNGNSFKWYESDGKTSKYIPKKRRSYAEKLARKKYLTLLQKDLLQEKAAIEFYLRHHNFMGRERAQLLLDNPAYKDLLAPYFKPISQELSEWMNSPYERSELFPEKLVYKTSAGVKVRSKSEALIVMLLHSKKVPFRYENLLMLGDCPYYPDFTIRHPQTGDIFYWEHFGMMDIPEYASNAFSKLHVFANYGIISGVNLITTFETSEYPLDLKLVEELIDHYFM